MSVSVNAKNLAKRLLRITLGDRLFTRYMSTRSRNFQVQWLKDQGVLDLNCSVLIAQPDEGGFRTF